MDTNDDRGNVIVQGYCRVLLLPTRLQFQAQHQLQLNLAFAFDCQPCVELRESWAATADLDQGICDVLREYEQWLVSRPSPSGSMSLDFYVNYFYISLPTTYTTNVLPGKVFSATFAHREPVRV